MNSNYSEMWENFLFGSLMNYSNLSEFFRGVHYWLIKRISTTIGGVFLIPRFLFRIKQWVEVKYTKVLIFVEVMGRGLLSKPDHRTFLGSFSLSGLVILGGVCIIWYQSFSSSVRNIYPLNFIYYFFWILVYLSF